jgi:hypothetical protein
MNHPINYITNKLKKCAGYKKALLTLFFLLNFIIVHGQGYPCTDGPDLPDGCDPDLALPIDNHLWILLAITGIFCLVMLRKYKQINFK